MVLEKLAYEPLELGYIKITSNVMNFESMVRISDNDTEKNLGRLWLAYTELQGDCTCYKSYLLTTPMAVSAKDVGLLWHY